jgi:hypothetical protein
VSNNGWLVDAHVHVHGCFDLRRFLDSADANVRAAGAAAGLSSTAPGCLLFAESLAARQFERFRDRGVPAGSGWSVEPTREPESLLFCREGKPRVVALAGRQVVTREGLEVLVLATTTHPPDGRSIDDTVRAALGAGAIAVLPWGFGKWWFARGRVAARVLAEFGPRGLHLGDNGGRPRGSPEPRLFRAAQRHGAVVLPGSDPLPFAHQAGNAGRYGFVLECEPDLQAPAAQIRQRVGQLDAQPQVFGRLESITGFLHVQTRIQARKLAGRLGKEEQGS